MRKEEDTGRRAVRLNQPEQVIVLILRAIAPRCGLLEKVGEEQRSKPIPVRVGSGTPVSPWYDELLQKLIPLMELDGAMTYVVFSPATYALLIRSHVPSSFATANPTKPRHHRFSLSSASPPAKANPSTSDMTNDWIGVQIPASTPPTADRDTLTRSGRVSSDAHTSHRASSSFAFALSSAPPPFAASEPASFLPRRQSSIGRRSQ